MTNGPYCYTYDADGLRTVKSHASGGSCTGTVTVDMLYWRNIAGNTIAETDGTGSTTNANYHEYIFFAGRRIAQSTPSSGSVYYYFADHLGSTRVATTSTGSPCYEADFLPYGTENTPSGFTNTCSTNYKFTGYERDAETAYGTSSGNDYAFARYYNTRLGRFMSADPLDGDIADPQTLNKYTYVRNNPVNLVDPSGLDCQWSGGAFVCNVTASPDPDPGGGTIIYLPGDCYANLYGPFCFRGSAAPAPPKTPSQVKPPAPKPQKTILSQICSAIPSGRTEGVSGGLGGVGSVGGGGELVVNYNSGQVSAFGFGGVQIGWNGGASGSVYTGFVYGLNNSNSNYSGGFTGVNGGAGLGGFAASSSGGLTGGASGLASNGAVQVGGASFGAGLLGGFSGGVTATNYTNPLQLGKFWAFGPLDALLYVARQACK